MRTLSSLSITDGLALSTAFLLFLYYMSAWWVVGRDPKLGPVVTRYEPPDGLSPAMLRYLWKQKFDDRAFWAAVLGLVAKRSIRISHDEGIVSLQSNDKVDSKRLALAWEERRLVGDLIGGRRQKAVKLTMLSETAATAIANLAENLRSRALGRWFQENTNYALIGAAFSCIPVIIAAHPDSVDKWIALFVEFAVMVPAAFYGTFLAYRIRDLIEITRGNLIRLPARTFKLFGFFASCAIAIVFGFSMLALTFGMLVFAVALTTVALTLIFTHLLKAPTVEGTRLLVEIEGFRDFLRSVEKLPFDRDEAPTNEPTRYERYLPYAVALEVEQAWSDKLVALASSQHEDWWDLHATCYYLGIWRGQPVDLIIGPPSKR
jgi:hypothetical protein